jgi:eukaryotic-like serine/threonine-protein kinase
MVCPSCGGPVRAASSTCERCHSDVSLGAAVTSEADADATRLSAQSRSGSVPATDRTALQVGQKFTPRYTILKLLGSGGMGEVYQAWDEVLGSAVALKIIRPQLALDVYQAQQLEERFRRELRLARQVTHTNVVRIHDLGEVDDIKYLTMQYVQGADLHVVMSRQGKIPIERALFIGRQIAEGLAAVHHAGIVHRDLKPANIILDADDHAILTDFGIARAVNAETVHTMPGSLLGTLDYMAPEQARGEQADQRSDIYAFGLILYELIAGGRPKSRSDGGLASLLERLEKGPPPLSSVVPEVPADTERLIAKCLASDPAQRYQSLTEVIADLDRLGPEGRMRPSVTTVIAAPPAVSRRGMLLAFAAALIAGLGIATGAWWIVGRRAAPPVVTREPVSVLIADFKNEAQDPVFEGSLEQALGVAIEGASFITNYPRSSAAPGGARLDESAAVLVAVREGIGIVLSGTIARAGQGYRLNVKALNPATRKVAHEVNATASDKGDVLQAVGRVAASLRSALGDTVPSEELKAETFSAASLKAVQSYTIAQTLSADRKNDEAIKYYREAIAEDPNFGRAYAGWATAAYDSGRREEATQMWNKAMSLIDRMTDREKYRTRGTYYLAIAHDNERAIENFTTLVTKYPADLAGHNNLAIAYFGTLRFPEALAEARRAIELYPKSLKFRGNYALFAMYASDFKTAADSARAIINDTPSFVFAYLPLAMDALAAGHVDAAKAVYSRAATIDAEGASLAAIGLADIALYEERYADAVAILVPAIDVDMNQKNTVGAEAKMIALAEAYRGLNRRPEALKAVEDALKLSHEDSVAVPAARILAQIGQDERAQGLVKELANQLQPQSRAYAKILEAERAIARGRGPEAMDALAAAKKLADLWLGRFVAGVANETFGRHVEARAEFEECVKRQGEATALFLDDIPTFRYVLPMRQWLQKTRSASTSH